jgi:hypothetical protein
MSDIDGYPSKVVGVRRLKNLSRIFSFESKMKFAYTLAFDSTFEGVKKKTNAWINIKKLIDYAS